ncbi:MAG: hypothetical protein M1823_001197 [Watsoniomyces obsoletus]|nr:MAG: hypothetical protein M1823_001197 [Watsoniomyces obsoletus]
MLEAQDRADRTDEANARRFEALEREIKDMKEKSKVMEQNNNDYEKRFAALEASSNCFCHIQNRCIFVYKRDRLQMETQRDRNIIGEGNVAAHSPSAVTQAALYRDRVREDFKVFLGLYELDPEKVLGCQNHMPTLKVLERHASLKIEGVEIPRELQRAYSEFVSLLETNGRQDYLHNIQSPEFRAYMRFWGISHTLVWDKAEWAIDGTQMTDGAGMPITLFGMIKSTHERRPTQLCSTVRRQTSGHHPRRVETHMPE